METLFITELKPFLDAVAEQMALYVPIKSGEHYTYSKYDLSGTIAIEFNEVRVCTPVKEFLFPMCELAAVFPKPVEVGQVEPFAVFGLKDCDLRSIDILDKVFAENESEDQFYINRRENMFIISTDCTQVGESCFCNLFGGQGFSESGFDLNVSKTNNGFIIETGSWKGENFIEKHSELFADVPDALLAERSENRAQIQSRLEQNNVELRFNAPVREIVQSCQDSAVYDAEAKNCVECQACTRVCPTCHCFYLYDTRSKDYFAKMKMWDSCIRLSYAAVAGGANPHKILGDRLKHRFMHKFVYFLDRYGLDMCVGCGRCIDACAGGIDIKDVLKKLSEEHRNKDQDWDKEQAKLVK